jgi:hypothetical protein
MVQLGCSNGNTRPQGQIAILNLGLSRTIDQLTLQGCIDEKSYEQACGAGMKAWATESFGSGIHV